MRDGRDVGRREWLLGAAATVLATLLPRAARAKATTMMMTRAIPKTGEMLPVIGLGTWQAFDVGTSMAERAPRAEVLRAFLAAGGKLIDSSPMYGRSEEVVGDLLKELGAEGRAFLATKVWTSGKAEGKAQMARSLRRMRSAKMDLMQVHNLVDWQTHLPVLREMKAAGQIRYIGITHYAHGEFDTMVKLLERERLDFVQVPYSIVDRRAEARVLPAAQATGTAVIVMTPFEQGQLFGRFGKQPLPAWAADFDCASWAQFFLKFLLAHPAVTCPIPATSKVAHLRDNVAAGLGRLPSVAQRKKMVALIDG